MPFEDLQTRTEKNYPCDSQNYDSALLQSGRRLQ